MLTNANALAAGTTTTATTTGQSQARALGVAGVNLSYPLYRRWNDATVVLEPLVQIAASPTAKQIVVGHDATGKPIFLD